MALETRPYQHNVDMVRLGKSLIGNLFVLLKTSLNYSEGHAAVEAPVAKVLETVQEIQARGEEASLRMRGASLFLGEYRLKPDAGGFEAARLVTGELTRRMIGRLTLLPGVTADELRRFVYALREVDEAQPKDAFARVLERMQQRMIGRIEVETLADEVEVVAVDAERLRDDRLKARLLYRKGIAVMEEVAAGVGARQPLRFRESKRVVQHMIDMLATHESCLLGLTAARSRGGYSQHHAVNVCILSLAVGRRLGMSKFHLCELGMAALFHDLGKIDLPGELLDLDRPLPPSGPQRQAFENHPLFGVRTVLQAKGIDALTARIISGIFEHHLLADRSGYPRLPRTSFSLVGRIISIADSYDGLTSTTAGGSGLSPEKAIRRMLAGGGTEFDQGLLKLFVNCVGLHGIGSLLLLASGEVAVTVENNADPSHLDHPQVRIIADARGRAIDGGIVDLAQADPSRIIVATADPTRYDLDVSRYLV